MACLEELQQLRFAKLHLHKTQDFWNNVQMRRCLVIMYKAAFG